MRESWSVHLLHGRGAVRALLWTALRAPSRTRRCCWAALPAAALRCELRAASCCAALLGVGGPEWHARDGYPAAV